MFLKTQPKIVKFEGIPSASPSSHQRKLSIIRGSILPHSNNGIQNDSVWLLVKGGERRGALCRFGARR
ncbi:hypothetical protein ERO13_A01G214401v2 [Gossypium hirsutum]|uniref:Uncharacterized protein n=2 Tax=Gossypium TaxID=3633 RepID=A0A5D2RX78_GOSTO|nr:hypothetical protein ERO13_A01G214401v2 [Gossypium hirsutum]TYH32346.1 hypothetical protein ES288_A01G244800v1 [Gossypium darwinii]TYI44648.1 hypothetical protein ES332_A01G252000v1 [Gossypium tomentosum]